MRKIVRPGDAGGPSPLGLGGSPGGPKPLGSALRQTVTPAASKGVLSPQAASAYEEAKDILAVAEREAQRTREEAERLRDEHVKQGYDEGYRRGYEQALKGLVKVETEHQRALERIEPQLVELAVAVAEKLLGRELTVRPEAIADIVGQALRTVRHQQDITIRVHPDDAPVLEEQKGTLFGILSRARDVRVVADAALKAGGCVIETEVGSLDADLGTQLEELRKALAGA